VGLEAPGKAALIRPANRAPDAGDRLIGVQEQDGGVLGAELAQVGHGGQPGGGVEQPYQVAGGEVQLGRQAGERPAPGQVGFEQAHRLDDGGMRRSRVPGRRAAGLRDGLAELAERNGHTMTESPMLNDILKDEWGFDGVVVSDWGAARTITAAKAGLDLVMPGPTGPWGPARVMLIDTALAYIRTGVESYAEKVVARALRGVTSGSPVIATKGGHWHEYEDFPIDGRPDTLRAHCEISLRALEVDRIDLYQLHHADPEVPLPESMGALKQLRREGKIAAIGQPSKQTRKQLRSVSID